MRSFFFYYSPLCFLTCVSTQLFILTAMNIALGYLKFNKIESVLLHLNFELLLIQIFPISLFSNGFLNLQLLMHDFYIYLVLILSDISSTMLAFLDYWLRILASPSRTLSKIFISHQCQHSRQEKCKTSLTTRTVLVTESYAIPLDTSLQGSSCCLSIVHPPSFPFTYHGLKVGVPQKFIWTEPPMW